ncbi:MAG: hypothetical protein ACM3XM_12585 [Mycobacterium leprae]
MGVNERRGHTGQDVQEAGTYYAESGVSWSYVRGDQFREDPQTHKSCIWVKGKETEHPGPSR